LHEAGREVVLACGRAPWAPRRIGGRDIVWWAIESGFMDQTLEQIPMPPAVARLTANIQATGHGGGHDLNLRTLHDLGVTLVGRFLGADGPRARFAPDLAETIAWSDGLHLQLMGMFAKTAAARGLDPIDVGPPSPLAPPDVESLDLTRFGAVVFTGGFRPDYGTLAPWPEAFDADGFPLQQDGASTVVDGLFFVGVHFLRTRRSSLLCGVGDDAEIVSHAISDRAR
jgi:putative flavoprotein involved in K+ transport